jgi:hypothetical protein
MAKAKIKTVDRTALKSGVYKALFGSAGEVAVSADKFFPGFADMTDVQRGIIVNGLTQKLNDSHAGAESADEAFKWTTETLTMLEDGKWTVRVPGEGGPRGGDFYKAIAEFRGISESDARDKVAALVDDLVSDEVSEKSAFAKVRTAILKKYPAVQEIINRMKAEKLDKADTVEVNL